MASQITDNLIVCSTACSTTETPKLHITGLLWVESTCDRWFPLHAWIPLRKQCEKYFHVMTFLSHRGLAKHWKLRAWCLIVICCHWSPSVVIIGAMASQITGVSIDYSAVWSGADQRKHQSSASLAFVRGIHRCLEWTQNCYYDDFRFCEMFVILRKIICNCICWLISLGRFHQIISQSALFRTLACCRLSTKQLLHSMITTICHDILDSVNKSNM